MRQLPDPHVFEGFLYLLMGIVRLLSGWRRTPWL